MNVELKRLMRHQRYIIERDSAKGVLHYGSEEELYKMSPYGLYEYEQEQQNIVRYCVRQCTWRSVTCRNGIPIGMSL